MYFFVDIQTMSILSMKDNQFFTQVIQIFSSKIAFFGLRWTSRKKEKSNTLFWGENRAKQGKKQK